MTDTDSPVVFVSAPSQHLTCPSCQKLYKDPVINISCGHTFCRHCALSISTCPVDGSACVPNQIVVNRLVVGQVDDLLVYCKYGLTKESDIYKPDPTGCQQKVHLGSRSAHEDICEFMPTTCANNNCNATFRKSEIEEHKNVCNHTPCIYGNRGCEYQGTRDDVAEHEKTCGYRSEQRSPDGSCVLEHLEETNQDLQKQITTLNMRVGQLEESNTSLQGQLTECLQNIKDLSQKYEILLSSTDQQSFVRSRKSTGNPVDGRIRSSSRSFRKSLSGSPTESVKYEKWAMPFQFKCIGTLRGHQNVVWCMACKNNVLCSAGADCCIKVWDLENLQRGCIKTIQGHSKSIQSLCIGGSFLYTGGHDNCIKCWSLDDYTLVKSIENAHDNIICVMMVVGDYLFSASFSLIKVWETKTLKQKHTIPGLHHWVRALALNAERDKLYSGSHNTIDIWSVTEPFGLKGKVEHQFGSIYSIAVTSKYIIAGTYNRNIHVFNVNTYGHMNALQGHIGVVMAVIVSPCEGFLFSCSSDRTIKFHKTKNICDLYDDDFPGTYNQNLQVFDANTFTHIQQLMGHVSTITSLTTSVSGRFLFSSSHDKSIQIWNLENMLPIQTLQRHEGSVNSLVVHGDFLFSGSEDKEIKWRIYQDFQYVKTHVLGLYTVLYTQHRSVNPP